jgi:hypothetical protein
MRPLILCRERLDRILSILDRNAGALTMREFDRTYSVWKWEVEQAAALGWISFETRKPRTGRPARVAVKVSNCEAAKLPMYRRQIEKHIGYRHANFALRSVYCGIKGGARNFRPIPCYTSIYLSSYADAKSRRGAAASMSRLLRRYDIRAVRAWHYAQLNREVPRDEDMPQTASAIRQRLREVGSMFA